MKYSVVFFILMLFLFSCGKKDKNNKENNTVVKRTEKVNVANTLKNNIHSQRLIPKIKLKEAENALKNKEYEKALKLYDELSKLDKLTAEARSQLFAGKAETLFYLKRYEESVAEWEKVIALRPEDPFAYQNLSLVLSEAGKLKKAIKVLDKILKLDNDILSARIDKINLMTKSGFPKEVLVKEAELYAKSEKHLVSRLKTALKNKNIVEISKILGYYSEIPEVAPPSDILSEIAKMKSIVAEDASKLLLRHKKGVSVLRSLIEQSKDPVQKKMWKNILKKYGAS